MNARRQTIFLGFFMAWMIGVLVVGTVYDVPHIYPIAGLLAFVWGHVFLYLRYRTSRSSPTNQRQRLTRRIVLLYFGFGMVASLNATVDGWHWSDLLYLVFPTVVSGALIYPGRKSQGNGAGQIEGQG